MAATSQYYHGAFGGIFRRGYDFAFPPAFSYTKTFSSFLLIILFCIPSSYVDMWMMKETVWDCVMLARDSKKKELKERRGEKDEVKIA